MLSEQEETTEIEAALAALPERSARVCVEALKIVQRHRGWVSDESIADVAEALRDDSGRIGGRRDLLQHDFPQAGGQARDPALRQRELLDHGLRAPA